MSKQTVSFSAPYLERLTNDYGPQIAGDLLNVRQAQVVNWEEGNVQYVRVGHDLADKTRRPVLFINGFLAGRTANGAFVADLASRGFDVLLQDQLRVAPLTNFLGRRDATLVQGLSAAAMLSAEGLTHAPIDVVTHSYGSLILDELVKITQIRRWRCLDDSKAILMAPAGLKADESALKFLRRYTRFFRPQQNKPKFPDSYWEFEKEMFDAGMANFKANPRLALREGYEIMTRRIDLPNLLEQGIGRVALVLSAEDELFSYEDLESSLPDLIGDRVTVNTPVSLEMDNGIIRGGRGADHSDHQFNPARVAGAVAQLLCQP